MNDVDTLLSEKSRKRATRYVEGAAIGTAVVGGSAATVVGVMAAGTSATAAISAGGALIGGVVGGVAGSSIGLVTGGVGIAATVPLATAGAFIGGWAGPALAFIGIGTAPAWAVPVAIGGGVIAVSGALVAAFKLGKARAKRKDA